MSNTAAPEPRETEPSAKVEQPATPLDQAASAIRADARRAPRTYARDVEVPGGGE